MPDKYVVGNYIRNVNHPWFNDIKSEFKQLRMSPNRLLLCILCIILMNIDETTFFETEQTTSPHSKQDINTNHTELESNGMTLYHENAVILSNHKSHYKQCKEIPMIDYFGSKSKNMFHTQLMIGVMFGFIMKCRIPVLFTFINIIIRSGCSFKPKSIPMFIDRMVLRPKTNYGSSYNLLNDRDCDYIPSELNYYEDDISSSDSDDDDDDDDGVDEYELNAIPTELFSEI